MDGSEARFRLHGHAVLATADHVRLFRRLSSQTMSHIFREALEHGVSFFTIDGAHLTLKKNPDHTFHLTTGTSTHFSL